MSSTIKVGIIGANARGGWAGEAHVPAVQALAGLSLAAVATNRQETADEAAHTFGADKGYASGTALIADPDIDLVTVATRVPDHRVLVLQALAAGKHVYSEWPLGRGSLEADDMARAAATAGVCHAVGLQLRGSPAIRAACAHLASGALGRLLSLSALSTTAGFGPNVPAQFAYLEDPDSFANLVTIQGAHTLDLLAFLSGGPAGLTALGSRQFPEVGVGEDQRMQRRRTFDHLLVQGRTASGTPFSMEVAGGRGADTPFSLDVIAEKGVLRLEGGAPRGLQSGRLRLLVNGDLVRVDEAELSNLPDSAVNVAGIYAALRDDILNGSVGAPSFGHAAELTRMMEAVLRSSTDGSSVQADEWQV